MTRWTSIAALALVMASVAPAAGQTNDERARALFNAGAAAYEAGDFLAAAQAFQRAHDVEPRAGLLFSIAQALRRHYVASGDAAQARLAIRYYRDYLAAVPTGGRRLEAAQAVSELMQEVGDEGGPRTMERATRLMVTSPTPGAVVRIDGGPPRKVPFNDRIDPGKHTVQVVASGYEPAERVIEVHQGDIVPLDLPLAGTPPVLEVVGADGAEVKIDGKPVGQAPFARPVELTPGTHFVTVEQRGHKAYGEELVFEHGAHTNIEIDLPTTNQRRAAYGVFATGGVFVAGAAVAAGMAFVAQREALDIERAQEAGTITQAELDRHNDKIVERDRLAATAAAAGGFGGAVIITGLLLYVFDEPAVEAVRSERAGPEPRDPTPSPRPADSMEISALPLVGPGLGGFGVQGRF